MIKSWNKETIVFFYTRSNCEETMCSDSRLNLTACIWYQPTCGIQANYLPQLTSGSTRWAGSLVGIPPLSLERNWDVLVPRGDMSAHSLNSAWRNTQFFPLLQFPIGLTEHLPPEFFSGTQPRVGWDGLPLLPRLYFLLSPRSIIILATDIWTQLLYGKRINVSQSVNEKKW